MCADNFNTHLAAFQDKREIADDSSREASLSIANTHDSIPLSLQIKILLSQPQPQPDLSLNCSWRLDTKMTVKTPPTQTQWQHPGASCEHLLTTT